MRPSSWIRWFVAVIAAGCCTTGCAAASHVERSPGAPRDPVNADRVVYVGTYTAPAIPPEGRAPSVARGIYVFRMHASDGHLTLTQVVQTDNPSFIALDPASTHLYCTNQYERDLSAAEGRVSAFAVERSTGALTFLNARPTNGSHPAHLSVHPSGHYLLASNYGEGDYLVYRIAADGSLGSKTDDVKASGKGPDAERQEGPHAHQILTDPDARYVLGVDLGADKVFVWSLGADGRLTPSTSVALAPGSGPRHMVFHPSRRFAFVLNELTGSITTFGYDPDRGTLARRDTISTLPDGFSGSKSTAEIRVHPNGRFLYATNRGHNSVAMFAIDGTSGVLHPLGWEPTRGEEPRGMNIDPSGAFLYAANQNSDTIVTFRIDPLNGRLTPTGEVVRTPTPVDIEFGSTL